MPPPDSFSPSPRSLREVGAGAGAVFEQARLAHPQVHDAALVDEVVLDRLDEAGMRLRMLVGRLRLGQLAGEGVDVEVALAGAVDAIGPVQAGVEPLRRVRRDALGGEHVGELVEEGAARLPRWRSSRPSSPNRSRCRRAGRRPGGRRSRSRSARPSGSLASAASSATERHSKEGTSFSSTFFRRAGTPALRKYFWARMSAATWLELRRHVDVVEPEDDRAVRDS